MNLPETNAPAAPEPFALPFRAGPRVTAWTGRVCFVLFPFVSFLMVEQLSGRNAFTDLSLSRFLLNLAFCYLTAMVFWLISGRTKLSAGLALVLFWALGMVNRCVLLLYDCAFIPADLLMLNAIAAEFSSRGLRPDNLQIILTMAVALALAVLAFLPRQKERAPLRLSSFFAGAVCAAFAVLFFVTPVPDHLGLRPDVSVADTDGFVLHLALCLREQLNTF